MELKNLSPDDPNKRRQNRTEKQSQDAPSPKRLQELRDHHLRTTSLHLDTASTSEISSVLPSTLDKGKRPISPEEEK